MNENTLIDQWLVFRLGSDAIIQSLVAKRPDVITEPGIYADLAVSGAAFPRIVFNATDPGRDVVVIGAQRIMGKSLYLVRAQAQTKSYQGVLKQIADRADVLLHGASGPIPGGGSIVWCVRQQQYRLTEVENGIQYRHLGGIYEINAQA